MNGTVSWSQTTAEVTLSEAGVKAELNVGFPDVDWAFLQDVYGWAALQWQAWARGSIYVREPAGSTIHLYTDRVLEYRIDGLLYFGETSTLTGGRRSSCT